MKTKDNPNILVLKYGVMASMSCGILELIRYNISRYITENSWISTGGFSTLAIIIIAMSLVIYLISYSANTFTEKIEKEQLLRMAFTDTLTGMPNRASCYRNIEKMEAENRKDYSIVFIDLNNLKKANDGLRGMLNEYTKLIRRLSDKDQRAKYEVSAKQKDLNDQILQSALFDHAFCLASLNQPEAQLPKYKQLAIKDYERILELFPKAQGVPIVLLTAAIMSLSFMGFGGMFS